MNHTEQAKVDMAKRMLKGQIDVEEVAMMSGLSVEAVQKLRDEQDAVERKSLGGLTVRELGIENVLIDNDVLDENGLEDDMSDVTPESQE